MFEASHEADDARVRLLQLENFAALGLPPSGNKVCIVPYLESSFFFF
jgi:hypothetical protein